MDNLIASNLFTEKNEYKTPTDYSKTLSSCNIKNILVPKINHWGDLLVPVLESVVFIKENGWGDLSTKIWLTDHNELIDSGLPPVHGTFSRSGRLESENFKKVLRYDQKILNGTYFHDDTTRFTLAPGVIGIYCWRKVEMPKKLSYHVNPVNLHRYELIFDD